MRRHAFLAVAAGAFFCARPLSLAADAFPRNLTPFTIGQGQRAGFVAAAGSELGMRLGADITTVYGNSWPNSQAEAKSRPDTLIFPLARTKAREPDYQWVVKVIDADVAFATAPRRP